MPQPALIFAIGLISLLLVLAKLRTFVNLTPSLVACVMRWKESVNLEESMDLARERDSIYFILILPDVLIASRYNIFRLDFLDSLSPELSLAITAGIFLLIALIRFAIQLPMGRGRCGERLYKAYLHSFRNFAIVASVLIMAAAGICSTIGAEDGTIAGTARITIAVCYLIYLIRKAQIFASANGAFSSFLYLCALELLPTAAVLAAAIVF